MKTVSIIIPVHNVENHIAQCLENLIYQTDKSLEIIIIDCNSTDNSAVIYNKYAKLDPRIKMVKINDTSVSMARNKGLGIATGEYIHFIDSNDYIDLNYYEKVIPIMNMTNADIATAGVISQNDAIISVLYDNICIMTNIQERFKATNALSLCSVCRYVFRRDFLIKNNVHFDMDRIFENMLFISNLIRDANKIVTIPGTSYHYSYNAQSVFKNKNQCLYTDTYRDCFANKHGLESIISDPPSETIFYKLMGCKVMKKVQFQTGHKKYYLLGMKFLETYPQ